jgi:hypothetical protein
MQPKKFEGVNITYAENQSEYTPLPAFKNQSPQGEVISCWSLSWKERLRILFKGEIWVAMMTFNKPLTPIYVTTKKDEVLTTNP